MIGQTLAHYQLETRLGEGGSGVVYRGRDLRLERPVAVKILADALRDDELAWARLLREARLASLLNHPHIAAIYDLGEEDDQAYIVMEYVEGLTLSDLIPDGGMPLEQVQRYAAQICDALAFAHEHGTLHGDLKGSNIIVTPEGNIKLLDFGLGRRIPRNGNSGVSNSSIALEESGATAGTLPYLAPEVLRGGPTTVASDVWALGVLLYQMTTGDLPFRGATPFEASVEILTGSPNLSMVPEALLPTLQGSLEKDPGKRIPAVRGLSLALQEASHHANNAEAKLNREKSTGSDAATAFAGWLHPFKWRIAATAMLSLALVAGIFVRRDQSSQRPVQALASVAGSAAPKPVRAENPEAMVWVNTDSGIYHCAGDRWYGKTHVGEYMKQKQARGKGYHPAGNHACY